jgi:hypothetical protein
MPSLQFPEYVSPEEEEDAALHVARWEFLRTIEGHAPCVLKRFHSEVFPAYMEARNQSFERSSKVDTDTEASVPPPDSHISITMTSDTFVDWYRDAKEGGNLCVERLATALDAWAERHRLQTEWMIDTALRTIRAWEVNPKLAEQLRWVMKPASHRVVLNHELQELVFRYHWVWEPTIERRSDADKKVKDAFNKELAEHFDKIEALAEKSGYVSPPQKKRTRKHFVWLVRRLVLDEKYYQIAKELGEDRSGMRREVKKLASYLKLPKPRSED